MESWDVYDVNRNAKGYTHLRGKEIEQGDYRMVVHACIFNTKGQMLIQQRQPFKQGWSNLWDVSVGGSVTSGESSQEGIHRELLEEIGFDYDFSKERPRFTMNFNSGFDDWYILNEDIDIQNLHLQESEVQKVTWATLDEIYQLIDEKRFIPYHKELFPLLFSLRFSYGAHAK